MTVTDPIKTNFCNFWETPNPQLKRSNVILDVKLILSSSLLME